MFGRDAAEIRVPTDGTDTPPGVRVRCHSATAPARRSGGLSPPMEPVHPPLPNDPRSFHVPLGSPEPPVAFGGGGPPRPSRRRRWRTVLVTVVGLLGMVVLAGSLLAWSMWRDVERVDLSDVTTGATTGTNYLIGGTDSREGVDADVDNAGVIFGEGLGGERTDTIAVLHVGSGGDRLLAIPRDLYVPIAGGSPSRINAAFNDGPATLVTTVQRELGIGIDHYLEVDFAGFLGLVDALGGVTIDFPLPARDPKSGLDVDVAGPVELDADEALAYVRSRTYIERRPDGSERTDPTADLGRVQRQQRFLAAVFAELGATWNPLTMLDVLRGVKDNVRVDSGMSFLDAARFGWRLRGLDPEVATVPTTPLTTSGGAAVLLLREPDADAVLEGFR